MFVALDAGAFDRWCLVLAATIAGSLSLVTSNRSFADDDRPVYRRYAIVASNDIEATGLGDLLTARLSAVEGIELVERDQLAAAIREQELSAYFDSSAAPLRLKLGQLLQADVLVLLSMAERETAVNSGAARQPAPDSRLMGAQSTVAKDASGSNESSLRLVISDCVVAITLVGRGFTDAGLAYLQNPRTVRELLLHGTSITPAGIADLKKTKPWLRVSKRIPN
jgi:hypothetical protein